jgi:isoleucyl-tRNA synthetase
MVTICISVQVVNRIQKLRKTAQLKPTDPVDVYYESVGNDKNTLEEILKSQVSYNRLINTVIVLEYLFS